MKSLQFTQKKLLMKEIEGTDPNIFHNMTDATLQKVATATSKDGNLMTLAEIIANGWPEDKTQVPSTSETIGRTEMN